jgi:hypothetical protein
VASSAAREQTEAVGATARTATPPAPQHDAAAGKPSTAGEPAVASTGKNPGSMGRGTSRKATASKAPAKTSRKPKQSKGGAATGSRSTGASEDSLGGPASRAAEKPPQRGGASRSN